MSQQKTCDEIIDELAVEAYEHYPRKDEVVGRATIGGEVDDSARKLLVWLKQDEGRRAALVTLASGSTCQLSAARAVRHRMIELHSSARTVNHEPAMA